MLQLPKKQNLLHWICKVNAIVVLFALPLGFVTKICEVQGRLDTNTRTK